MCQCPKNGDIRSSTPLALAGRAKLCDEWGEAVGAVSSTVA